MPRDDQKLFREFLIFKNKCKEEYYKWWFSLDHEAKMKIENKMSENEFKDKRIAEWIKDTNQYFLFENNKDLSNLAQEKKELRRKPEQKDSPQPNKMQKLVTNQLSLLKQFQLNIINPLSENDILIVEALLEMSKSNYVQISQLTPQNSINSLDQQELELQQ